MDKGTAPIIRIEVDPFHLASVIAALRLEVKTGLRHSHGSVLRVAQEVYGIRSRTKAAALAQLEVIKADIDRQIAEARS
jgi:hypothetical protein